MKKESRLRRSVDKASLMLISVGTRSLLSICWTEGVIMTIKQYRTDYAQKAYAKERVE